MEIKERARKIIQKLAKEYPGATCSLTHTNPLELLISTILSAQCTDERVNIVTADLFRKYRNCRDYLNVSQQELEQDIHSTGFYHNKAKAIQGACKMIIDRFGGVVPGTLEELIELPGVARKTANVALGVAFGTASGIVVDTHVSRVAQRLGLTEADQAEKIERDLMELVPKKKWIDFSHQVIQHGRKVCQARKPMCDKCVIEPLCPSSTRGAAEDAERQRRRRT